MKNFTLTAIFSFLSLLLYGQGGGIENDTIRVGYVGSAPFVIESMEGMPEGIVVDIWSEIAGSLNRPYDFQSIGSIDNGMLALNADKIDILIGPITINSERASRVSFTQPFYKTDLAILAPVNELSIWGYIKPFFTTAFLYGVLGLLLALGIVGFLFWLLEARHYPEEYSESIIECIGLGAWLAVVTMTTVGYGDFAPKTAKGRFLMGSWMIISLAIATTLIAGIATTFTKASQNTVQTITQLNQIHGNKVAVPDNRQVMSLVRAVGATPMSVNNAAEAYELLQRGEVDVVLYDEVQLQYTFKPSDKEELSLSTGKNIRPQYYGFMLPKGSILQDPIDEEIIRMRGGAEIKDIISSWTGKK